MTELEQCSRCGQPVIHGVCAICMKEPGSCECPVPEDAADPVAVVLGVDAQDPDDLPPPPGTPRSTGRQPGRTSR